MTHPAPSFSRPLFACSVSAHHTPVQYNWEHCIDMTVGQTYEIHWPHSTVGACGTPYQYQTPFYDGTCRRIP